MNKLNKDLKMALNEISQIGRSFNGNHKVQVVARGNKVHYLNGKEILLELKRPLKCPKFISDIEELTKYKSPNCTDKELNILIDWFSKEYINFKGKTIQGVTNFERLDDEFEAQNAVINEGIQVLEYTKKSK